MRELRLGPEGNITRDTLSRISCNTPNGVLFPKLERLFWNTRTADSEIAFFRLFLSPRLKSVTLCTDIGSPLGQPEAISQIISSLPISLDQLLVISRQGKGPISDAISSLVCRSGSSLGSFGTRVPLSEAAVRHLMQLPNLRYWKTVQGPPLDIPTSIFPSLEQLHLAEPAALPWIYLLASHRNHILQGSSTLATSRANVRETLESLKCTSNSIVVDSSLLASVTMFRNLVTLCVRTYCSSTEGCTFRLTDNDVENFASGLPRLRELEFGLPCHFNSCDTTVASLLSISTHCLDLVALEIHFNTRTIVGDIQRLVDGGAQHDEAKCALWSLTVGSLQPVVREEDIETVAMGLKIIFPRLVNISYHKSRWYEVKHRLSRRSFGSFLH